MAKVRKALIAGLGAGVASLATSWTQTGHVDNAAIGVAVGAVVVAALAVWRVPNAPKEQQ